MEFVGFHLKFAGSCGCSSPKYGMIGLDLLSSEFMAGKPMQANFVVQTSAEVETEKSNNKWNRYAEEDFIGECVGTIFHLWLVLLIHTPAAQSVHRHASSINIPAILRQVGSPGGFTVSPASNMEKYFPDSHQDTKKSSIWSLKTGYPPNSDYNICFHILLWLFVCTPKLDCYPYPSPWYLFRCHLITKLSQLDAHFEWWKRVKTSCQGSTAHQACVMRDSSSEAKQSITGHRSRRICWGLQQLQQAEKCIGKHRYTHIYIST